MQKSESDEKCGFGQTREDTDAGEGEKQAKKGLRHIVYRENEI